MAKLKRTQLHTAASRQPVIPGLGLPLGVAGVLVSLFFFTMILFRGWRSWLVLFVMWALIGVAARVRVQRDRNAFRVDAIWLRTKALFLDAPLWRGVTLKSFPHRKDPFRPRGIFR